MGELLEISRQCHRYYTCYKWKYKKLKRIHLSLRMSSSALMAVGSVVGFVTHNPIVLGSVGGLGVMLSAYTESINIEKRKEGCRFAAQTYKKLLIELEAIVRGADYDEPALLAKLEHTDKLVVDRCPAINGTSVRYDKVYGSGKKELYYPSGQSLSFRRKKRKSIANLCAPTNLPLRPRSGTN